MALTFAEIKKSRQSSFEKLKNSVEQLKSPNRQKDDRFWQPTVDKMGNGYAVIRFLPEPVGEEDPFVRLWSHGFQDPGGWYIENSLSTLKLPDPMLELNGELWNSGIEENKKRAQKQKRNLHFISNIYVVLDQGNPENNGKVFLFKYGKKIFNKLDTAMTPEFPDDTPMNPFDLELGANFKLKIRNVEGYRNYDRSEFEDPAPLFDNDADMERVWKQTHSLKAFLDPSNFKSYEVLKALRDKVLGLGGTVVGRASKPTETAPPPAMKSISRDDPPFDIDDDDGDDDTLSLFKKLAQDND